MSPIEDAEGVKAPLVTVIVPAYNAEEYIEEALQSVLSQALWDLEVLVIDDGSTDSTAQLAEQFKDPRCRVIRKPNGGVSSARNAGLARASGKYISFLDADDRWRPRPLGVLSVASATLPTKRVSAGAGSAAGGVTPRLLTQVFKLEHRVESLSGRATCGWGTIDIDAPGLLWRNTIPRARKWSSGSLLSYR